MLTYDNRIASFLRPSSNYYTKEESKITSNIPKYHGNYTELIQGKNITSKREVFYIKYYKLHLEVVIEERKV